MRRMLWGVSSSTLLYQRAEVFRNWRRSVHETRLLKTSALLSTAWRWKIKPWAG